MSPTHPIYVVTPLQQEAGNALVTVLVFCVNHWALVLSGVALVAWLNSKISK